MDTETFADGEGSSASGGVVGDSGRGVLLLRRVPSGGDGIGGSSSPWVVDVLSGSVLSGSIAIGLRWSVGGFERGAITGSSIRSARDAILVRAGSGRSVDLLAAISASVVGLRGGCNSGE